MTIMSPSGAPEPGRIGHGVALIEEVVGREVLNQIAEDSLDAERQQHGPWNVALGVACLLTHRSYRLEPDQDENGDAGLNDDERESMRRRHRGSPVVELEVRGQRGGMVSVDRLHLHGLAGGVGNGEGHRLAILHLGHRHAVIIHLGRSHRLTGGVQFGLAVLQYRLLHDVVVHRYAIDELEGARALAVVNAVRDGHHGKHQQSRDLDDVDRHVHAGGARDAPERDVGHAEGKAHTEENHEEGTVDRPTEGVGEELIEQIAAEDGGHAHHAARIHPVVEVTRPSSHELGDAGEPIGLGVIEKGLLGEEVGRARPRIELGQFGVADGRGKAQQQGRHDAEPHRRAGQGRAVEGLHLIGEPQECARRDQRHGIHGQARQTQCGSNGAFPSTAVACCRCWFHVLFLFRCCQLAPMHLGFGLVGFRYQTTILTVG